MELLSERDLNTFWDEKLSKYPKPKILKGYFDNNYFYTLNDNKSIFFFVLVASDILKKSRSKSELNKVYVATRSECSVATIDGSDEQIWFTKEPPIPMSCQRPYNDIHATFLELIKTSKKASTTSRRSRIISKK